MYITKAQSNRSDIVNINTYVLYILNINLTFSKFVS